MTTVAQAVQTAEAYVAESRPWCFVTGVLENDTDYFVATELNPGYQWPLGPGAILISKETGELRTEPYGAVADAFDFDAAPRVP